MLQSFLKTQYEQNNGKNFNNQGFLKKHFSGQPKRVGVDKCVVRR